MKKLLLAAPMWCLLASGAQAGCSIASLNGYWIHLLGNAGFEAIISGGVFFFGDDKLTITSFGANCRGAGTYFDDSAAATYDAVVAAEAGVIGTARKPLILDVAYDEAGTYRSFRLVRR